MTAWSDRRLSRRFSTVGVDLPAARLREIAAGGAATPRELVDMDFALVATAFQREQRHAQRGRRRQRWVRAAVVSGAILLALNLLISLGLLFFVLTQHTSPY